MGHDGFLSDLRQSLGSAVQEGDEGAALFPRSTREIQHALRMADRSGARFRPPGGSVRQEAVPIALPRMSEVLSVDERSHLIHIQAGMTIGAVESVSRRHGLTLGVMGAPPDQPVGVWLARGAPGAREQADDPVDHLVAGMDAVLPNGQRLAIHPAPRRAVGPDLLGALVGARGRLGVIAGVHLVARRHVPYADLAFWFTSRGAAEVTLAWIRGRGIRPVSAVVVDAPEGVALKLRLEGVPPSIQAARTLVERTAAAHEGVPLGLHDAPPTPSPSALPQSPIVRRLAARIDPRGVLGD